MKPEEHIPLFNIRLQHQPIQKEINEATLKVLESAKFILGPENSAFEKEFAKTIGVKHCITCASGAAALQISLTACGIGPGDEVITTPFTFISTASSITLTGAKFVFVDIDPKTLCIDPKSIEEKINKKTKAILPVHLYGYPADMNPIMKTAKKYDIKIIEDCAQSHLAKYYSKTTGNIGHIGAFSFYPSKNLGACGDGGAITTNDENIADLALSLRHCGRAHGKSYEHSSEGSTLRMDEIQAAILRVKLRRLKQWTEKKQSIAAIYNEKLKNLPIETPPSPPENSSQSFYVYTIKAPKRNELMAFLKEKNIASAVYYPLPLYKQPVYKNLNIDPCNFPNTEKASLEVLSLPMFAELTHEQIDRVCRAIAEFYNKQP